MSLEIGANHPILLREESLHLNCGADLRVLYLSDLHFTGRSCAIAGRILHDVAATRPDLILLGGDYADSRRGLALVAKLAASLVTLAPVCAIGGNHDYFLGIDRVRGALEGAGAIWIERRDIQLDIAGNSVLVSGSRPAASMPQGAACSILCLHKPAFDPRVAQYDLAFAGHLHGGQVVLWETGAGLFPGRLFYRWNRRSLRAGACRCIISAGLGDTLPIRYNCPRDMILVRIGPSISDINSAST